MDTTTLLAALDFSRARLLSLLDTIEKSGQDPRKILAWRPGPGRAHIAWQAMHCAATHDKYLNVRLKGGQVKDEAMVKNFGGGSIPSDENIPSIADIRQKLESTFVPFKQYVATLTADDLSRVPAGNPPRSVGDSIIMMAWHESHHQGQAHLTWNLCKQALGIK